MGGHTFVGGDDETQLFLFYSDYRPGPVSHDTSPQWTTKRSGGAYRMCLLFSTICYLFASMGAIRLQ